MKKYIYASSLFLIGISCKKDKKLENQSISGGEKDSGTIISEKNQKIEDLNKEIER